MNDSKMNQLQDKMLEAFESRNVIAIRKLHKKIKEERGKKSRLRERGK